MYLVTLYATRSSLWQLERGVCKNLRFPNHHNRNDSNFVTLLTNFFFAWKYGEVEKEDAFYGGFDIPQISVISSRNWGNTSRDYRAIPFWWVGNSFKNSVRYTNSILIFVYRATDGDFVRESLQGCYSFTSFRIWIMASTLFTCSSWLHNSGKFRTISVTVDDTVSLAGMSLDRKIIEHNSRLSNWYFTRLAVEYEILSAFCMMTSTSA